MFIVPPRYPGDWKFVLLGFPMVLLGWMLIYVYAHLTPQDYVNVFEDFAEHGPAIVLFLMWSNLIMGIGFILFAFNGERIRDTYFSWRNKNELS